MNKNIHMKHDAALRQGLDQLAGGFEEIERLSRRRFLRNAFGAVTAGLLAAPLLRWPVLAKEVNMNAVKTGVFVFPRLEFAVLDNTPDRWDIGPTGDVVLRRKLRELTNINVSDEPKVVRLADMEDMYNYPFVFMTSEGFFELSKQEEKNLREFLERGGFILADDCVFNTKEDRFFQTYVALVSRLFPANPMRDIPLDHEIFQCYYQFKNGCPHMQGMRHAPSNAMGLFESGTDRLLTFATPGDIHCGWMCRYWEMAKNMEAIKMGVNVVIYALSH